MGGLTLRETLTGTFRLTREPLRERAIALQCRASTGPLGGFLRRRSLLVEGSIDAEGLAAARAIHGTVALSPRSPRALAYDLSFLAGDDAPLHLRAERSLQLAGPGALTLLPAQITGARGELVAECLLRFDLRTDLGALLRSVRRA